MSGCPQSPGQSDGLSDQMGTYKTTQHTRSGLDAVFSHRWWFLCMKQVMWINMQLKASYIKSDLKSQKILPLAVISFPVRCMCSSWLFKERGIFKDPLTTKVKMRQFLFRSGTGRRVWKLYIDSKTSDKSHLLQQVFSRASLRGYKLLWFSMLPNNLLSCLQVRQDTGDFYLLKQS